MEFIELNILTIAKDDVDDWVFIEDYLPWVVSIKSIRSFIGTSLDFKVHSYKEEIQTIEAVQIFFDKETSIILKETTREVEENYYVAESYHSLCQRITNNVFNAPEINI